MPPEPQYFRHKGNGRLYRLLYKCQHKSVCPGLPSKWIDVIVYQDDQGQVFTRQAIDFFAKFEPVDLVPVPPQDDKTAPDVDGISHHIEPILAMADKPYPERLRYTIQRLQALMDELTAHALYNGVRLTANELGLTKEQDQSQ
jgi:hypothetical protein